jgi:protein gp37
LNKTKIEYVDSTWNPATGCYIGCGFCYAKTIAERFSLNNLHKLAGPKLESVELREPLYCWAKDGKYRINPYPYGFVPTFHEYRLNEPVRKNKGQNIFVCSMGDLFGDWVPSRWIWEVLKITELCPQHRFLFLTKNPKRYVNYTLSGYRYDRIDFPLNCCIGTTVTDQEDYDKRMPYLDWALAERKFISCEPLLGPINLNFKCCSNHKGESIDWVIIGAQTGKDSVQPKAEWVQSIIDQCRAAGVPVFVKNNLNWNDVIQEYPWVKDNNIPGNLEGCDVI